MRLTNIRFGHFFLLIKFAGHRSLRVAAYEAALLLVKAYICLVSNVVRPHYGRKRMLDSPLNHYIKARHPY